MLVCPVGGCRMPLIREERRAACVRGHSFDIARSGYINLLQPQERRSKHPGDTVNAIEGRRRLHESGVTEPFARAIGEMLAVKPGHSILDVGCGDGFYLGTLASGTGCDAHGVDISVLAIQAAAKRYPKCEWVVANADRFIPYANASFSVVMSMTARMNAGEFRRVLSDDGRLLVAIPAPEDLVELRGVGRDRVERTIADFEKSFLIVERRRVLTTAELEGDAVQDVLHLIYRPMGGPSNERVRVTFGLDFLLFRARIGK